MLCRLTIRGSEGVRQWDVVEWTALAAIASLSTSPDSLAELLAALRRYQPDHRLDELGREVAPWEGVDGLDMWCVVDLLSRTLVGGGEFQLPEMHGGYEPSPGEEFEGFPIVWMDTPPRWSFQMAAEGWPEELARRAEAERSQPRIEHRIVLYGPALLEHLADQTLAAAGDYASRDRDGKYELTQAIHASWLMTPRSDLGGRFPRHFVVSDLDWIDRDLEHRSQQWSRQRRSPPPLDRDSVAYRFSGFGTIEAVTYFDLIRTLLDASWQLLAQQTCSREQLIEALAAVRNEWLQTPYEGEGPTAAELVELERRRMPITADAMPIDCDCPICRAEADGVFGSAPAFMFFDAHRLSMEDLFVFSLEESYDNWLMTYGADVESGGDRFMGPYGNQGGGTIANLAASSGGGKGEPDASERLAAGKNERAAVNEAADSADDDSVWQSSYVNWNQVAQEETSAFESLLAISFPLAEIITDLKELSADRTYITELNEAYDALRRSTDRIATESSARHFCEMLEKTCARFPVLTGKCADLQSHVDEVLRKIA